jgi:hypothetical protein
MDTISHGKGGTMFEGRQAVEVYRLNVLIKALELHKLGIQAFRGCSALQAARVTTGLRSRKADDHIARLRVMLNNALAQTVQVQE